MKKIFFIYEIDSFNSLNSIVIKFCTTNTHEASKFFKAHKKEYQQDEEFNLILAEYEPNFLNTEIDGDILRELTPLNSTIQN